VALIVTSSLSLGFAVLIPLAGSQLAGSSYAVKFALLSAHQLLSDGFAVAFLIQAVTLRQTVLPKHHLGRANAAIHLCTSGVFPVAALVAGAIAATAGTYTAVWVGIVIGFIAPVFLWPLRNLRELPSSNA